MLLNVQLLVESKTTAYCESAASASGDGNATIVFPDALSVTFGIDSNTFVSSGAPVAATMPSMARLTLLFAHAMTGWFGAVPVMKRMPVSDPVAPVENVCAMRVFAATVKGPVRFVGSCWSTAITRCVKILLSLPELSLTLTVTAKSPFCRGIAWPPFHDPNELDDPVAPLPSDARKACCSPSGAPVTVHVRGPDPHDALTGEE